MGGGSVRRLENTKKGKIPKVRKKTAGVRRVYIRNPETGRFVCSCFEERAHPIESHSSERKKIFFTRVSRWRATSVHFLERTCILPRKC